MSKKSEIMGFCPICLTRPKLKIYGGCCESGCICNRKCIKCGWTGHSTEALLMKKPRIKKIRITDEELLTLHLDFPKLVQPENLIVNLIEDLRDARKELRKKN
jgi:hypothetical protein